MLRKLVIPCSVYCLMAALSACGGGTAVVDVNVADESANRSRVILGPIVGATLDAFLSDNTAVVIESTVTTGSAADLDAAGSFQLQLAGVDDTAWVLVVATGGRDIDIDDDGVADAVATPNLGQVRALGQAQDWRSGGSSVTILSEIALQRLLSQAGSLETLSGAEIEESLNAISAQLLTADANEDGTTDYQDILDFLPLDSDFPSVVHSTELNSIAMSLETGVETAASQQAESELDAVFNQPPTASAGDGQTVVEGERVDLLAVGSDSDGAISGYQWTQDPADAIAVTLAPTDAAATGFSAPLLPAGVVQVVLNFSVRVFDDLGASAVDEVAITVLDSNNMAPVVTSPAEAAVVENTTAVLNLNVSDGDTTGGALFVALGGADSDRFQLAGSALSFRTAPDYENPVCSDNLCTVTLTPSDGVNVGAAQNLTIRVLDANDNAPVMSSAATVSVAENSVAVLSLSANDIDTTGEVIQFILGGADAAQFQIEGDALSFQSAADFETPICGGDHQCQIELTPSDGVNTGSTQAVTVTITDVNDSAPVMTSASAVSVLENDTAVLTLTASDADTTGEAIRFFPSRNR